MAFSIAVEMLNLRLRKKSRTPVRLHDGYVAEQKPGGNQAD